MSFLQNRITRLIDGAYEKGQTTLTTTISPMEASQEEEVDQVITDLRAQGFQVSHDDVFNDLIITLPEFTFAERARRISYNADSVSKYIIQHLSRNILGTARRGGTEEEYIFDDLSTPIIIQNVQRYFRREGFEVTHITGAAGEVTMTISWKDKAGNDKISMTKVLLAGDNE